MLFGVRGLLMISSSITTNAFRAGPSFFWYSFRVPNPGTTLNRPTAAVRIPWYSLQNSQQSWLLIRISHSLCACYCWKAQCGGTGLRFTCSFAPYPTLPPYLSLHAVKCADTDCRLQVFELRPRGSPRGTSIHSHVFHVFMFSCFPCFSCFSWLMSSRSFFMSLCGSLCGLWSRSEHLLV